VPKHYRLSATKQVLSEKYKINTTKELFNAGNCKGAECGKK
jgi:hypothetical protein